MTSKTAIKYLQGLKGVEIGGSAHNGFGLDTINVDYTDDMNTTFKQEEIKMCGKALPVDVVAEGDKLPFKDGEYDFVINSHVAEHIFDMVGAIKEWIRVSNKYVFMIIPHMDRTFDEGKEPTSLQESIDRHEGRVTPEMRKAEEAPRDHWWIGRTQDFLKLCAHYEFPIIEWQDVDDKVGNGFMVIIDVLKYKTQKQQ